jgi:glycerate kinase
MIPTMTVADRSRGPRQSRRVLLAPDSFKGTLTARQVADALAGPLREAGYEADQCPLADGGEGTAEALLAARGGERVEVDAHDPLGRVLRSSFVLLADRETAVVETAAASGPVLVAPGERDPERASTRGTGELIVAAAKSVKEVLVGVGGSATTDGGRGALEAIATSGGLGGVRIVCLCDVRTPWELAARTFGPQKGADPAAVDRLSARLERFAEELPRDPRGIPRSGAAGGLAGGLWAVYGAELVDGASFVLSSVDFDARLRGERAVVTGEGRLDTTTPAGKVVSEVARRARLAGIPAHAVVGEDATTAADRRALGLASVREASTAEELASAAAALARDLWPAGR